jgi:hypothetical protein
LPERHGRVDEKPEGDEQSDPRQHVNPLVSSGRGDTRIGHAAGTRIACAASWKARCNSRARTHRDIAPYFTGAFRLVRQATAQGPGSLPGTRQRPSARLALSPATTARRR